MHSKNRLPAAPAKTKRAAASPPPANASSRPRPRQTPEPGATRERILDATFRCLATKGYAALRVRDIAEEAGVNVALVNYHFGSKDQLVLDVLDAANQKLLERQKAMYGGAEGFAAKWAQARRFYEADKASGFVRVQAELMAAGYSNTWLGERVAARVLDWGDVIQEGVREALAALEAQGLKLPAPLTAGVIANWIGQYWIGLEVGDLLGWSKDRPERSNEEALNAVQTLLEALDARVSRRPPGSTTTRETQRERKPARKVQQDRRRVARGRAAS
jgi:AcrR family transcriptional regulator